MKTLLSLLVLSLLVAAPETAFAKKKFRQNDRTTNNTCDYVYSWYKKSKTKHAVFVTTGGVSPFGRVSEVGYCQAGGADTLKEATDYAITRCNREAAKRSKKFKRCKVVERR